MSLHHDSDIAEQLSALADGELDSERTRFLLRRMAADAELRAAWARLHLARACIKREDALLVKDDFAAAVAAAIAADPAPGRGASTVARVGRWVTGAAVAASVAMLALVLVAPQPAHNEVPLAASEGASAAPGISAPEVAPSPLRESDLRPSLAAQTAAAARRSGAGGALGPVAVAQPLYLPHYLARAPAREGNVTLLRDAQGGWVMMERIEQTSALETPPER